MIWLYTDPIFLVIASVILGGLITWLCASIYNQVQNKEFKEIKEKLQRIELQLNPSNPPLISKRDYEDFQRYEIQIQANPSLKNFDDLVKLGIIEYVHGKLDNALSFFGEALDDAEQRKDRKDVGICLGNMGIVYAVRGDLDKALEYYEKSLEIDREIGYRQGEANQLGKIGVIYQLKGDFKRATKYLNEALGILEKYKPDLR